MPKKIEFQNGSSILVLFIPAVEAMVEVIVEDEN